jgi:pSer/pThr/pTyr-binding forkhead associated (FHA) protein
VIKCPFCQAVHPQGTVFCDECGTYLLQGTQRGTDPLGTGEIGWTGAGTPDTAQAEKEDSGPLAIRLIIGDGGRSVELPLSKAVHLGRLDPSSEIFPEVDLTPDGGLEKGVSRRHARIHRRENMVVVEDLGSINGTFLNGRRLTPYLSQPLQNGDQLQLGKLLLRIELN